MGDKATQPTNVAKVTEVTHKTPFYKKLWEKVIHSTRKQQIIAVVLAIAVIGGIYAYFEFRPTETVQTQEQKYAQEFLNSDNSDSTKERLVDQYGTKYDSAYAQVIKSNPANWDKAMLDNACLALLYADKIGAFNQVNSLLAFINAAESQGLNIDDNSYGVNQGLRNTIRQRANTEIQQQLGSAGAQN